MCLYVKSNHYCVAENDIECYKFFEMLRGGRIASPYYHDCIWKPGELKVKKQSFQVSMSMVGEGFFHSFVHYNVALSCGAYFIMGTNSALTIWKCVIPKGAEYYYGLTAGNFPSYASRALKLVEEI